MRSRDLSSQSALAAPTRAEVEEGNRPPRFRALDLGRPGALVREPDGLSLAERRRRAGQESWKHAADPQLEDDVDESDPIEERRTERLVKQAVRQHVGRRPE